jgi:hypothetical protein
VRPGQIRKGATQAVVGCLVGGSGPKSVGGSSWMNSELDENGKDTVVLDWFTPPESKTLRPVWWNYAWKRSPLEWSSRLPYMAGGLGFPFEVGGPSSGSVTDLGRSPSIIIERIPQSRTYWRHRRRDLGRSLFLKPGRSSAIWIRSSKVFQGRRDCG